MRTRLTVAAIAAASALLLTGCVDNSAPPTDNNAAPGAEIQVDQAAEALLPDEIREAGKLMIGMDIGYAPNEFKKEDGSADGWAVELGNAMAAKLGLTTEYQQSAFDRIIPAVNGGTFDIGYSSFTDTAEREQSVDFVNYYNAGVQWAQQIGKAVDPDNACGLTVSVQATTYEETEELPAKSAACEAAGKEPINILKFESQDEATNALALGRADAMSADSPITQYAVAQVSDKIELAGDAFEVAPYGIAVKKGSELAAALQAALQSLVDDGTYMDILTKWGVQDGAIDEITINAATKG
ncbi:ABC transporter substrate-binding protein [Cryobacterium sp. BB736]|uniref:ABC transporter substrate-binding protein n=1 Tax=Cryobacterium sp. BB736 TaxID=2746963 RepID=UPI00187662F0|nr:ABC transporter substrate-binding protein [Cryobacterium sp. BB736]